MNDFEVVWQDIINSIEENNVVITLANHCPNQVTGIIPDGLLVQTIGNPNLVKKDWIKVTWNTLLENRTIVPSDIPGRASYRSSFILALLARLDYVNYTTNPLSITLNMV